MDSKEERSERQYNGYVIGTAPTPDDPETNLWKIRVQTLGKFYERRVTIEHGSVPRGIFAGMDVHFNLATCGRNSTLVATNVEAYIRQQGQPGTKEGRTE